MRTLLIAITLVGAISCSSGNEPGAAPPEVSKIEPSDPAEDFIYDAKIPDNIERFTGQEFLSKLEGQPPYPNLLMLIDTVAERQPTRIITSSGIVLAFNRPGVEPPVLDVGAEIKAVGLYIGKGRTGPEEGRPVLDSCVLAQ